MNSTVDSNSNGEKTEKVINLAEICLLCGGKKQEKNPVCGTCRDNYVSAGQQNFIETGRDLPFLGWLLQQAQNVLPKAQKEYDGVKAEVDALREQGKQVMEDLGETDLQKHLSNKEFDQVVQARKEKLWKDNNGDKHFGDMKRLEDRLKLLPGLIEQLGYMGAKKEVPPKTENQQTVETVEANETAVIATAA